jgi:hypothetical protein
MAPHATAELWEQLIKSGEIHESDWAGSSSETGLLLAGGRGANIFSSLLRHLEAALAETHAGSVAHPE